jgi:hypothetical protein
MQGVLLTLLLPYPPFCLVTMMAMLFSLLHFKLAFPIIFLSHPFYPMV